MTHRRLRTAALVVLAVCLAASTLVACSGSNHAASNPPAAQGHAAGVLVVGAEQWPACINPITQCANSSWLQWTVPIHVLPRLMELDAKNHFVPSPLLAGPPTVSAGPPMTVTYHLDPRARWEPDNTRITSADVKFSLQAYLDTRGSLGLGGYSLVAGVDTPDPSTAVVTFKRPISDWQDVGGGFSGVILEQAKLGSTDLTHAMQTSIGFSGGPWMLQSFDGSHEVLVANTRYWDAQRVPKIREVEFVPTRSAADATRMLASGAVDVLYPQADTTLVHALAGMPDVEHAFGATTQYENVWFNEKPGRPFSDPNLREAFSYAFDRKKFLDDVVRPFFPAVQMLQCAAWVPAVGNWCTNRDWADVGPDAARVVAAMHRSGYAKDAAGYWSRGGDGLVLHWMENTGNRRRESTQQEFIPELARAGFRVVTDNSPSNTMFEQRLPAGEYDFAMFIQVASPDPSVTAILASNSIPGPANGGTGQNDWWYSNAEADALMNRADAELDDRKRADEIDALDRILRQDYAVLPLYVFPSLAAWRRDRVAGPVDADIDSPESIFWNLYAWSLRR